MRIMFTPEHIQAELRRLVPKDRRGKELTEGEMEAGE